MNTNIKIELDDHQRNLLARFLSGNPATKRLATRNEVKEFVRGCVDRACNQAIAMEPEHPAAQPQAGALSFKEVSEVERLRYAGYDDSYIRGWIQVGRRRAA